VREAGSPPFAGADAHAFRRTLRQSAPSSAELAPFSPAAAAALARPRRAFLPEHRPLERQARHGLRHAYPEIVGDSPAIVGILRRIDRFGPTDVPVLILGPSGAGKESVARALHAVSPRRAGPWVAYNCACASGALAASELFGHVRGAFTGADRDHSGLFVQAAGGTLALDEVGDLPVEVQAHLLRVLSDRSFRPVGGTRELRTDARIVAMTSLDLYPTAGRTPFRAELLHRLEVGVIELPPLSTRRMDIPLLVHAFAGPHADRFTPGAVRELEECPDLGDIRGLRNLVEAVATWPGMIDRVQVREEIEARLRRRGASGLTPHAPHLRGLRGRARVGALRDLLAACGGRHVEAAARSGYGLKSMRQAIRSCGLDGLVVDWAAAKAGAPGNPAPPQPRIRG